MTSDPTRPDTLAPPLEMLYRSEAFAEDLEALLPHPPAAHPGPRRVGRPAWFFVLPLAVVLIGSVSALAWT